MISTNSRHARLRTSAGSTGASSYRKEIVLLFNYIIIILILIFFYSGSIYCSTTVLILLLLLLLLARIINLTDDKECYIPSSNLVMHILRWLAIEVTAKCGNMQWRHDVKELVRKSLAERYANMQGDVDEYAERCANMFGHTV